MRLQVKSGGRVGEHLPCPGASSREGRRRLPATAFSAAPSPKTFPMVQRINKHHPIDSERIFFHIHRAIQRYRQIHVYRQLPLVCRAGTETARQSDRFGAPANQTLPKRVSIAHLLPAHRVQISTLCHASRTAPYRMAGSTSPDLGHGLPGECILVCISGACIDSYHCKIHCSTTTMQK